MAYKASLLSFSLIPFSHCQLNTKLLHSSLSFALSLLQCFCKEAEMRKNISLRIKKLFTCHGPHAVDVPADVDFREEYARAFRTESYNEFWTRVNTLIHKDSAKCIRKESTTADRLPSYRLFAECLLDPDQPTVTRILALARSRPEVHALLSNYFSQSADASFLCGILLKDVDQTRVKYKALKSALKLSCDIDPTRISQTRNATPMLTRLVEFTNSLDPFATSAPSPSRLRLVQAGCSDLLKQLESCRDEARAKLQLINNLKRGSGILLVALTASLTVILVTHAIAILVAGPSLIMASLELASTKRLSRLSTQLDAAAKGTYIVSRDLETVGRLVAQLKDELEHMRSRVRYWLERGEDGVQGCGEVGRQLKIYDLNFVEHLDELEEHLYLCFMTINRARNLVIKEIVHLNGA